MTTQPSYNLLAFPPEIILTLLAQGINQQYDKLKEHPSAMIRQTEEELHPLLTSVLPRLSALYICEGTEDKAACIHTVMEMATRPMKEWGVDYFAKADFPYRELILIDPETLVPTYESYELASQAGGWGEDQILEKFYHQQVYDLLKNAKSRRDKLYTAIREFMVRHPLATSKEIEIWLETLKFPHANSTLASYYRTIPSQWLHSDGVHQCSHCGGLLKPHPDKKRYPAGLCVVNQCRRKGIFAATPGKFSAEDTKLLNNQLLTYWVGPGLDEIKIYDAARQFERNAVLYPNSDACDISLDDYKVGIDAKSYISASLLISRLNHSVGRLVEYDRKIIAISDELNNSEGTYLATLRSQTQKTGEAKDLEFMTVSALIQAIQSGEI